MKILYIKSARKILQNKKELERKLKVKILVKGTSTTISGKEADEYFAERVLKALDFPFLVEDALLLLNEEYMFEVLNIKFFTKRHDLAVVRGRIIGKKGKTLGVLQNLSNCIVVVKDNNVAIIGRAEEFPVVQQAVISLIQGAKQGNVYGYLERRGKKKKHKKSEKFELEED